MPIGKRWTDLEKKKVLGEKIEIVTSPFRKGALAGEAAKNRGGSKTKATAQKRNEGLSQYCRGSHFTHGGVSQARTLLKEKADEQRPARPAEGKEIREKGERVSPACVKEKTHHLT